MTVTDTPELGAATPTKVARNKNWKPPKREPLPERPRVETVVPPDGGMPLRLIEVPQDEDGYPGWWVKARINLRAKHLAVDTAEGDAALFGWLRQVVHAWNWVDEGGKPLPLPREADTFAAWYDELPDDGLLAAFIARYGKLRQAAIEAPKASSTRSTPG